MQYQSYLKGIITEVQWQQASTSDQTKILDVVAQQNSNDLKEIELSDNREFKLRQIISYSRATFLTGLLGALTMVALKIYDVYHEVPQAQTQSVESIIAVQNFTAKLNNIEQYILASANQCKIGMVKINELHRAKYPEKYSTEFGYHKRNK